MLKRSKSGLMMVMNSECGKGWEMVSDLDCLTILDCHRLSKHYGSN